MARVYNFSSGPAVLPEPVLQTAQQEFLDWHGRGYSIMETSHRSEEFVAILAETEQLLRALLGGMRASIYNAMPLAGVQALVGFMRDFERRHG